MAELILGTRGSQLALWQAHYVQDALHDRGHGVKLEEITTTGDKILDVPLAQIGDKALFTKELDVALLDERIDLAVHSLKDLPTQLPDGIILAAVSERAAPGDAFVAHPRFDGHLAALPEGAQVATSSLRRQAQLLHYRPDLDIVSVRGNVDTRLRKLDASNWHGMVLAVAGLARLGLDERIREVIDRGVMLPAVSQGALGIVCRESDGATREVLRGALHDAATASAVLAERAFLRRLEGGCQVPIGAYAKVDGGRLVLDGCVAALDGERLVRDRHEGTPDAPEALGRRLAEHLLQQGADEILTQVRTQTDA